MSDVEIAVTLDLPLGTVKSRIRRARLILTERIAELAKSPEHLRSTLDNLEAWAAQVRGQAIPT
jgi:RNA polymerase sigma-70 factor (ECF subfamily)